MKRAYDCAAPQACNAHSLINKRLNDEEMRAIMEKNKQSELTGRYQAAADSLVDKLKKDTNVIAVILCGSLSYDQVWEKSDIDMALVVRDQVLKNDSFCIVEDDITVNINSIVTRSGFKRYLESLSGGSMLHSLYARGKIIYSTDESLYEYFEEFKIMGSDDRALTVLLSASELYYYYEKCQKWLQVKENPLYAQYYLLKAAEVIARIEVCARGEIPDREALVKAYEENPGLMSAYYSDAMSHQYSPPEIRHAAEEMERYMERHLDIIKKPILEYMSDHEMKTVTMISKFFKTESHFIIGILEYLAEKGIIAKVSQTIKITPKSRLAIEEIAFQYIN